MEISPQDRAAYLLYRMKQMMVVVPVDADIDKAEHIAYKYRKQGMQCVGIIPMRHFHFQYHNSDDDGNHSIAESFQPIFSHKPPWFVAPEYKSFCVKDENLQYDPLQSADIFNIDCKLLFSQHGRKAL